LNLWTLFEKISEGSDRMNEKCWLAVDRPIEIFRGPFGAELGQIVA
jgi:hypothetical protein